MQAEQARKPLRVLFAVGWRRPCAACQGAGEVYVLECSHRQPCPCGPVSLRCTRCDGTGREAQARKAGNA